MSNPPRRRYCRSRMCPQCEGHVVWLGRDSKCTSKSRVRCRNKLSCGWVGVWKGTTPRELITSGEPSYMVELLEAFQRHFNYQEAGFESLLQLEEFLLDQAKADPDQREMKQWEQYIRRLSQLRLLVQMIDTAGLSVFRSRIVGLEIDRLFGVSDPRAPKK